MERGDSIDRGRRRYLGSLAPAPCAALPCWQRGQKGMMKDTEGEMAPSPPCQLLPVFNGTRAQQGMQSCPPTPLSFISAVITQVGPFHGWFLAHNPTSHSHRILRGFPQLPAVSKCSSPGRGGLMGDTNTVWWQPQQHHAEDTEHWWGVGFGTRGFDADGRCEAFCFPVRGERDSGVKMLVRGETSTSVGKTNGEQSETARVQPGVKRRRRRKAGRKWGSLQAAAVDLLPLTLCQYMGSFLDPTSPQSESRICPQGRPGPLWLFAGILRARNSPSAGSSLGELDPGGTEGTEGMESTEGRQLIQAQKNPVWARSCVQEHPPCCPPGCHCHGWAQRWSWAGQHSGAAALGAAGSARQKLLCSMLACPWFIYRFSKLFS